MLNILKKRQFKLLLACISLLILIDLVQDTYAKYVSSTDASSNLTIARWAFLINNQDVLTNNDFSNTIIPTFDQNANIASGVIAPTSTGYFDIVIDSTDTDVAFNNEISLSKDATNTVSDLVFTGYKINDGQLVTLNDVNNTTITTNHPLNEINTVNTYRIYIKWNDDSTTENMNNAADTTASQEGIAKVNVNVRFIQNASNPTPIPDPTPEP